MMSDATLVIAASDVVAAASRWTAKGLLGDGLWLDSSTVAGAEGFTDLKAVRLRVGYPDETVDLSGHLATLMIDEVRVWWVRTASSSTEPMEVFRQGALHHWDRIKLRLADVVLPEGGTIPERPDGSWIETWLEERVAPAMNAVDCGYEYSSALAVHLVAALAGLLGGRGPHTATVLNSQDAQKVQVVSRMVGGGPLVNQVAHDLQHELADGCMADFREGFVRAEGQDNASVVDAAEAHLLTVGGERGLDCPQPAPSAMQDPGSRPMADVLAEIRAFVWWAFRVLVVPGYRSTHWKQRLARQLEHSNLGHHIDEAREEEFNDVNIDVDELDQRTVARLSAYIDEASRDDDVYPDEEVWRELIVTTSSLSDGGELPGPLESDTLFWDHDQRVCVTPEWTIRLQDEERDSQHASGAAKLTESMRVAAVENTMAELGSTPAPLVSHAGHVARVADELAAQYDADDQELRDAQVEELRESLPKPEDCPPPPQSLLSRLRARVHSHWLRTDRDAERWRELALQGWAGPQTNLHRAIAVYRSLFVGSMLLITVMGPAYQVNALGMSTFLDTVFAGGVPAVAVWSVLGTVSLLTILSGGWTLYFAWRAYMQEVVRHFECRELLADRVVGALRMRERMENASRLLRFWHGVWHRLTPAATDDTFVDPRPADKPESMVWGEPDINPKKLRNQVAATIEAGWLREALWDVASAHQEAPTEDSAGEPWGPLLQDHGLGRGALERFAAAMDDEHLARSVELRRITDLRLAGVEELRELKPDVSAQRPQDPVALEEFLAETNEVPQVDTYSTVTPELIVVADERISLAPALAATSIAISHTPIPLTPEPPERREASGGDGSDW